jgi:hypothetical protein
MTNRERNKLGKKRQAKETVKKQQRAGNYKKSYRKKTS